MNLLLTGGYGFLGSSLLHYLNNLPDLSVWVLDKFTYAANAANLHGLDKLDWHWQIGDICDKSLVNSLFEQYEFDQCWHWAAETMVDKSIRDSSNFINTNIFGTHVLLEACREYDVPFVFKSTDEVLGAFSEGESGIWDDNSPINPKNPYSASKASGELLTRAYMSTHNLKAKIIRCCNVYGPRQHPEKMIPTITLNVLRKKRIPVYPSGYQIREWLFVDDYCSAIMTIMNKGKWGKVYNLSSENSCTNRELVTKIFNKINDTNLCFEALIGNHNVEFKDLRPNHDFRYSLSATSVKNLGWKPQVSLSDGLDRTIEWYKNNEN